jgi:rhodanese-related sulfurtransferase
MSPHFARVAKEVYGYKNVKYMVAGHMTWQSAINAYYTEPEFLKMAREENIAHILVDLRSPEKAAKEHIAGAVNFPADDNLVAAAQALSKALSKEQKKKARIIYYSDDQAVAERLHKTMRANYVENGYILNGGLKGWKAKGYPVASNALADKITYEGKTTLPGSMTIPDFEKIAGDIPADTVIVDVRSPSEWMKTGVVPGVLTIPIDTMNRRWKELPRDKTVILQCAAGNRALQVWRMLADKGYKDIRWVDGNVDKFSKGLLQEWPSGK